MPYFRISMDAEHDLSSIGYTQKPHGDWNKVKFISTVWINVSILLQRIPILVKIAAIYVHNTVNIWRVNMLYFTV